MLKKLLLVFALLFVPIASQAAECTLYEQSHPSFVLDGAHLSTGKCSTCASCHKAGVFLGTPRTCVGCHNGDPLRPTVGRPANHIPTSLIECSSCHNTTSFANWNMRHTVVTAQRCDTCHNSTYSSVGARAKPREHIPTTADCVSCHNTNNWDVNTTQLHAGITTGCVSCHDGNYARGKSAYTQGHPITSDNCETCHSVTANFKCATIWDRMRTLADAKYLRSLLTMK